MVITYQGLQFFKLSVGDLTLAVNAPSKESKIKVSRFGADIALQTLNHPDMNGGAELSHSGREPFLIKGPGEYEVKEVFIKGFPSESEYAGEKMINTIYSFTLDNMNICFLGALSNSTLTTETVEALDDIDILFVPIGGEDEGVLSPAESYKLAVKLEPRMIIPMQYDDSTLKTFLKEASSKAIPVDKLTIKRKDLEGKESEVAVLSPLS